MKRILLASAVLIVIHVALVSCGSVSSNTSTHTGPSGLKFRAFVSNPLEPTGTGSFSQVLNIVDASLDEISPSVVALSGTSQEPGLMALSPNKQLLLVFSDSSNTITVVNTGTESTASSSSGSSSPLTLPGPTQSMFVSADNATGYAAVPTAPVTTAPPTTGAVVVFSLTSQSITATIPVPAVQVVVGSHNGNRVLALGENSSTVTVIAPSYIGTGNDPRTPVSCVVGGVASTNCFDHPAFAIFSSDDSTAYVLSCGPECGGTTAGITVVNLNTNTAGATIPLPGAGSTVGLLTGSTLYVAGSPPGTACGSGTAAPTCGTLSIVNLSSMTVTNTSPILITDGNHDRMEMGANGQLFIGASSCSNVSSSTEVRGCLSIFDTNKSAVVIPPDNGDVTGIEPITNRSVVYLCEGGNFRMYDTTTDKLLVLPANQNPAFPTVIVGLVVDVKLVD